MNKQQKKDFDRIRSDFSKLRNKKDMDYNDEEKLIYDIQGLLGIFKTEKSEELADVIEEMIRFGENQNWSMAGSRILFEKIKID